MAESILPPEGEQLATGWEPDLRADDTLVRQAVLVHAAWPVEVARHAGRPWRSASRWAGAWIGERGRNAGAVYSDGEVGRVRVVDLWDGRQAAALQRAMRLSNEAFAAHLGIATRTVANRQQAESWLRQAFDGSFDDAGAARPQAVLAGVRIDTASARLLQNDLEGALTFAEPVLALNSELRIAPITGRIEKMRQLINASSWSADRAAEPIRTAVQAWLAAPRPIR